MFNPAPPYIMLMDINSCFATIEQQANPLLRGKPVVVGAYTTDRGIILAASREAKQFGIKTGMQIGIARARAPHLVALSPDPPKYRWVNKKLQTILARYTDMVSVKSIDEMALDFRGSSKIHETGDKGQEAGKSIEAQMVEIAKEIKERVREEIGEWITLSIGIAPNQYLAKIASNYHKPDGLTLITRDTVEDILGSMKLEDLTGIKEGYGRRLRSAGITNPLVMYHAPVKTLMQAFASKIGYDWWLMLHGWPSDLHEKESAIKTVGHSYALKIAYRPQDPKLHQILSQLVEKMARRLRSYGFRAQGVYISCLYTDYTHWGHGEKQAYPLFAGDDLYARAHAILLAAPDAQVRILAVSCYMLSPDLYTQQSLFAGDQRKERLMQAIDAIDDRWGDFSLFPGRMLGMEQKVLDRIAFGGAKDLTTVTN